MAIAHQKMTLDEFLALPEEKPALELVDGEVTQKAAPQILHAAIQAEVVGYFNNFARPRKLGRAFPELRGSYDDSSTVPDVAYYVRARVPRNPQGLLVGGQLRIQPDIAVEIVSPEQSVKTLLIRCLWYVAHGVQVAIMIDPDRRWVTLFRPAAEPIVLYDTGMLDLNDVIPGFVLDVAELFQALNAD